MMISAPKAKARGVRLAILEATADAGGNLHHSRGGRYAISLANRPLIEHVISELVRSEITRVIVVAQHDVRLELGPILGSGHRWGIDVSYVDAPAADRRGVVLAQLERALRSEPVLLHPGDCLFGAGDVDSVLPEQMSVASPHASKQRQVAGGPVALGPGAHAVVADLRSPAGEGDDLISALLASDCRLAVSAATDPWSYDDAPERLLAGNRRLLDRLPGDDLTGELTGRNELHGRIAIHPTAYVSDCVIAGPVLIDERAVLESSFIGPYTAIGAGAVLRGAEIDNSMVLSAAEIHHPGLRIESSIIGQGARVTRSFQLPRGVHLLLGPGARLDLS
jgi:glucose-1-phosphate thymidylyltransferase